MRLQLRPSANREASILEVQFRDLVRSVKERACAAAASGENADFFQLVYAGSVLEDATKLADFGVVKGSTLWLLPSDFTDRPSPPLDLSPLFASSLVPPTSSQSALGADLLRGFLNEVAPGHPSATWQLSPEEWEALNLGASALDSAAPEFEPPPHMIWFGEYGCVLLADMPNVAAVRLRLVCLDGWTFWKHSHPGGRTHTSRPTLDSPRQLLFSKDINLDGCEPFLEGYTKFLGRVSTLLEKAQERKGEKRSAAGNQQGHQKSPAMIEAIVMDALNGREDGKTPARGGFTDVGLHTGGHARDATWPLARAVMQVLLEERSLHQLYRMAMAQLALWETERLWLGLRVAVLRMGRAEAAAGLDSVVEMLVG